MRKLTSVLNAWPIPAAAMISWAMIAATVSEDVTFPDWMVEALENWWEGPERGVPAPDASLAIPYAPAPSRDDRTPIAYISHVFGLGDPDLPTKLSGIDPVYWDHGGRGSGALIAPNLVLTTGHLFADSGKWEGPYGLTHKPPAPSDGDFYVEACGQSYDLKAIHLGSMTPRVRLGLDYAIVELATPVCEEATALTVARTPDDLVGAEDQIFLNIGAYAFDKVDRYADHPLFAERAVKSAHRERQAVFGVRCEPTGRVGTGRVADGDTGVIITEGCDGVPGGSCGPVILSRDGGATYSIVGVANSYRPNTEYNNYTRIEGAFAAHLASFVDVGELPAASTFSIAPSHSDSADALGPWQEISLSEDLQ
ncbi:hypothetical protein [Cognatiyoonia sp. IB215182]|uniref:trypsin-like serine peptidase n=1 Tax=Cognatiyoonia sp. IB215182 TaxID=3097353 RepID=UPI002A1007EF|nr:hypothetical protein [Cognatiyoonia sp. IB215182]MDX8353971.1 hypothetical protein [Cognatiyoonia sp. IB215182]